MSQVPEFKIKHLITHGRKPKSNTTNIPGSHCYVPIQITLRTKILLESNYSMKSHTYSHLILVSPQIIHLIRNSKTKLYLIPPYEIRVEPITDSCLQK